ncbi:hypothetical protein WA026_023532 [Henosepilachna vigintioctopunctata]|uniref:Uncharacterized protein n=1 Tax=Henosepilachna vigintioctopunctata TaxID=420089 RepID=A0AAW1TZ84_9CUCU
MNHKTVNLQLTFFLNFQGINDDSQVVHPQNSEENQPTTLFPSEVQGTKKTFKSPKALKSKSAKRRLVASPGPLDEALNVMRSLYTKRANMEDEYSLYGEQIAIKLRNLSSPRTRLVHGYNVPQVNMQQNPGPANPMVPPFPQASNMPNQFQPPIFTELTNASSNWFSTSGYSSMPSSISSYSPSPSPSPASTGSELSNMDPFPQ